jgi:hypothetical protein
MSTSTPSAGARLRADLHTALARAAEEVGHALEFDEAEAHTIEQAAHAADRAEQIRALYEAELASPDPRPRTVVALAAEARLSEKAAVDLVARVSLGLGAARSPRHVRAAQTRWQAERSSRRGA